MYFDRENILTTVNAEKAVKYSYGYFSNNLESLESAIKNDKQNMRTVYAMLKEVFKPSEERRFYCECGCFSLFYPTDENINGKRY